MCPCPRKCRVQARWAVKAVISAAGLSPTPAAGQSLGCSVEVAEEGGGSRSAVCVWLLIVQIQRRCWLWHV